MSSRSHSLTFCKDRVLIEVLSPNISFSVSSKLAFAFYRERFLNTVFELDPPP